jgi:hypothetical protein
LNVYPEESHRAQQDGRHLVYPEHRFQGIPPTGAMSHCPTQREVCLAKNPDSTSKIWQCVSQDINISRDAVSVLREWHKPWTVYEEGTHSRDSQWWPGDILVASQLLHGACHLLHCFRFVPYPPVLQAKLGVGVTWCIVLILCILFWYEINMLLNSHHFRLG